MFVFFTENQKVRIIINLSRDCAPLTEREIDEFSSLKRQRAKKDTAILSGYASHISTAFIYKYITSQEKKNELRVFYLEKGHRLKLKQSVAW